MSVLLCVNHADELTCRSKAPGCERDTILSKSVVTPNRAERSVFYFKPDRRVQRYDSAAGALILC